MREKVVTKWMFKYHFRKINAFLASRYLISSGLAQGMGE